MKLTKDNIWVFVFPILIIALGFIKISVAPNLLFVLALLCACRLIFYSFNGEAADNSEHLNLKLRVAFIVINIVFAIYYIAVSFAPFINQFDSILSGIPFIAVSILFAITSVPSMYILTKKA